MDGLSAADYALAVKLQKEFDSGAQSQTESDDGVVSRSVKAPGSWDSSDQASDLDDPGSWTLVDSRWEIIDPLPDIRALFLQFNDKYFWGRLAGIEVKWSPRMTLCAGLCVYQGHGGLCSVRLSEPLLKLRPRKDLIETLLHEMIHAYLFVTDNNKDHDGHGPEFHKHMYRLNNQTGTNISVYHNFHDEVNNYRQHWWKCDGPCQNRPPYNGYVKRAMNRAPSPRDPWWADHQRTCGGTYHKVKEPEGYKDKNKKQPVDKVAKKNQDKPKGNLDIRSLMGKASPDKGAASTDQSTSDQDERPSGSGTSRPNIHGFEGSADRDNTTGKYRANIHGFGKLNGDSDEGSSQSSSGSTAVSFPGKGKSLSRNTNLGEGPIVRRLPGIGLVTTERNNPPKETTSTVATPAAKYDSEESDFDMELDKILKPKRTKKSKDTTPKGFVSVSNLRRLSDPDRWKQSVKLPLKRSGSDSVLAGRSSVKRKADSLAADRNKRVCCLDSSDSDTDVDEDITLGTVVRTKTQVSAADKNPVRSSVTAPISPNHEAASPVRSPAFLDLTAELSPPPPPPPPTNQAPAVLRDCPVCQRRIPESDINDHLDLCLAGVL